VQHDNESPTPDRTDRWLEFWDVWSRSLPPECDEITYADLTMEAFGQFEKHDAVTQAENISRAWGIIQRMPKRRQRKSPVAVVVPPPPRWEPCPFWRGEPCTIHEHALPEPSMRKAQSLFEIHAEYVRRRIYIELLPWASANGREYDLNEAESTVWLNVANRMPEYVPLITSPSTISDGLDIESTKLEEVRARVWLKAVVHTTVIDVVRGTHAKKRDVDKEVSLPEYAGDMGIENPDDPTFAKPTPVRGMDSVGDARDSD
jgi:hypothetical protein